MARKCSVCQHSQLNEINRAIVRGESKRAIARQYGLSKDAVRRHANNHIPGALMKAKDAEDVAHSDDLFAEVRSLKDKGLGILDEAKKAKDLRVALAAIREVRGCFELLARMVCEIDRRERERPGRPETRSIAPLTRKKLVITRTPQEQREFERVIKKVRETAEEVGLKLPEGDGDSGEALREAGLLSGEWTFEERMKLERTFEEIMEARRKRGKG